MTNDHNARRERIAAQVLTGMSGSNVWMKCPWDGLGKHAVEAADALIAELDRTAKSEVKAENASSDDQFRAAFAAAADPLIRFLNGHPDRLNPHHQVIVTPISAELVSGEVVHRTTEHVED